MSSSGATASSGPPPNLQNGVLASGDLAASAITVTGGTGSINFTLASASPFYVLNAAGALVSVVYTGQAYTLVPSSLPAASQAQVYGIEIDTNGVAHMVNGTAVSGPLTNTVAIGIAVEANTPATTSGRLRVLDVSLYNASGTYKFGDNTTSAAQNTNWVDRRPWARGLAARVAVTGAQSLQTPSTWTTVAGTGMAVELTGRPLRATYGGAVYGNGGNKPLGLRIMIDGSTNALAAGMIPTSLDSTFSSMSSFVLPANAGGFLPAGNHYVFLQVYSASTTQYDVNNQAWSLEEIWPLTLN